MQNWVIGAFLIVAATGCGTEPGVKHAVETPPVEAIEILPESRATCERIASGEDPVFVNQTTRILMVRGGSVWLWEISDNSVRLSENSIEKLGTHCSLHLESGSLKSVEMAPSQSACRLFRAC